MKSDEMHRLRSQAHAAYLQGDYHTVIGLLDDILDVSPQGKMSTKK